MSKHLKYGISLMIVSSSMTCVGQLMWKLSNSAAHPLLFLLLGFALYGLGAILMILALRFGDISILQPMLSAGFIVSIFLGYFVLHEQITLKRIAGILCIIGGMVFLGKSSLLKEPAK